MDKKTLIVISGSDRVGKSTLVHNLSHYLSQASKHKYNVATNHFGAPDIHDSHIFNMYYKALDVYCTDQDEHDIIIWDRSYICGYILERIRRNGRAHHQEFLELENRLYLHYNLDVKHITITPIWSASAGYHLEELMSLNKYTTEWSLIDELEIRRLEHNRYNELLHDTMNNVTMYPHINFNHFITRADMINILSFING